MHDTIVCPDKAIVSLVLGPQLTISRPDKVVPEVGPREIIKYTDLPKVNEEGEEDSAISSQDEMDLHTNKYFDPADSSALIVSTDNTAFTKSSQSLGSLDQMIAEAKEGLSSPVVIFVRILKYFENL